MGRHRIGTALCAGLVSTLLTGVLAACGGSTPSADDGDAITLGTVSTGISSREMMAATDLGYFAGAGLNAKVEKLNSDAQLTPLMANGEMPMAYLTYVTTMNALKAGIPLRMVSGVQRLEPRIQTAWVRADSPIRSAADLRGAVIGVSSVGGFGNVLFGEALAGTGTSLADVTLTEVSFPEMAAALERGDIDVGWLPAPFAAAQRANPNTVLRQIIDFDEVGSLSGLPQGGIATTAEFAEKNPRTIATFREQERRAAEDLARDPEADRQLQIRLGGYDPAVATELPLQSYAGSFTAQDLEQLRTLMVTYGLLSPEDRVDLAAFVGDAAAGGGA